MQPSRPRRQGPPQWAVRVWPLWVVTGVVLIVVGVAIGGNLGNRGGPFVLGLIFLIGGVACAIRYFRGGPTH
jgi:hypothetical protein